MYAASVSYKEKDMRYTELITKITNHKFIKMGFLIIVAVIVLAICLIRKSASDDNSSFEETVKPQITFNDLIRKAEILMTICAKYEYGPKYELHKDDVEKYALPNLSR